MSNGLVEVLALLVDFLSVDAVQAVSPRIKIKYKLLNKYAVSLVLNV
jgi:hypothetical protein